MPLRGGNLLPVLRAAALGIATQAVSSGTHFLFGALLVRQLTDEGFGAYGVAFSIFLLGLNLADALVLTPMVVRLSQIQPARFEATLSGILRASWTLAALASPLLGVAAGVMFWSGGYPSPARIASLVTLTSFFYLCKEVLLRLGFVRRREGEVLIGNLVFGGILLGLTWAPWTRAQSPEMAVAYYGGASALTCAVLAWIQGSLGRRPSGSLREEASALFEDGRWYVGSNVTYWLRIQSPILASTWILGLPAVGLVSAARILVTPTVLLNPSLTQVALPRLSRLALAPEHRARFSRGVLALGSTLVGASVGYGLVLMAALDPISRLLIGTRMVIPRALALAWCAYVVALAFRNAFEVSLKARRSARRVLAANLVTGLAALPLCMSGAAWFGPVGVVWGAVLAETLAAMLLGVLGRQVGMPAAVRTSSI